MKRDWFKFAMYYAIAFSSVIVTTQKIDWVTLVAANLAGLTSMKALDSNPNKK